MKKIPISDLSPLEIIWALLIAHLYFYTNILTTFTSALIIFFIGAIPLAILAVRYNKKKSLKFYDSTKLQENNILKLLEKINYKLTEGIKWKTELKK